MNELERRIEVVHEWLGTGSLNFFGRQFAGKDVHAKKLGKRWGVDVIGGGDIMRNAADAADQHDRMNQGELSETERYQQLVLPYLSKPEFAGRPLLLSAIGRMEGEEKAVIDVTNDANHPIKAVPYLNITEDESFRRLGFCPPRGRDDDTPEGLRKRLNQFNEWTLPVLETYRNLGLLVEVDAMPAERVVFRSLVHSLYERAQQA